ncbi:MAG: cation diffusion facilitator family transporter, partial [Bdellovibrionota bacterium]
MSTHSSSWKVILFALGVNLSIAAAKFAGAFLSGSASLYAEGIHSAVDSINQILLLIGERKASRSPNARHPLGYGREAYFWSFLVAIALLGFGGIYSIAEGVHKISAPGVLEHSGVGCGILVFGFVLEAFSFRACLSEVRAQNRHGSLWNWFRRSTSSELLVLFA